MVAHESLRPDEPVESSTDRAFGIVMAVAFTVIGLLPILKSGPIRLWSLGIAATFLLAAFVVPRVLAPLNFVWTRIGLVLHVVVSPIVLGAMFYLAITPMALLLRIQKKDLLRLSLQKDAQSYWIDRTPPGPTPDSLTRQF